MSHDGQGACYWERDHDPDALSEAELRHSSNGVFVW